MHVQRVGYTLDHDFLVERIIVNVSGFDAPCAESKRSRLLKGCVVGEIGIAAVFDAADQAAVDFCNLDIAILAREDFDGNLVLTRVANNLVDERWQPVDGLHRSSGAHGLNIVRPLVSSREPLIINHVGAVSLRSLDGRLVAPHSLRKQRIFFAFHCHASRHYVLAHPRIAG